MGALHHTHFYYTGTGEFSDCRSSTISIRIARDYHLVEADPQTMKRNFDAIIIGTGQAGPSLAARFSAAGMTVAIIERDKFGGTCVNTGCIPTKTLVASAYAIHT